MGKDDISKASCSGTGTGGGITLGGGGLILDAILEATEVKNLLKLSAMDFLSVISAPLTIIADNDLLLVFFIRTSLRMDQVFLRFFVFFDSSLVKYSFLLALTNLLFTFL